jgi:hypothetical protein
MNAFTRAVRRIIAGPTDEQINERVIAEGGPGYPIPPIVSTTPPTRLVGRAEYLTPDEPAPGPLPLRPAAADRVAAASAIAAARADHHPLTAEGETVTDEARTGTPHDSDDDTIVGRAAAPVSAPPARADNRPPADPITDSGVHHLDPPVADALPAITVECTACGGTGHVSRTLNELLRETVALIPVDGGDQVIREFYRRLLNYRTMNPDGTVKEHTGQQLAPLFPRDLLTAATQDGASPGAMQRDKLLNALLAVSELYGGSPDDMDSLDTAIGVYGRSHAAFQRPDGTVRGATEQEYEAVIDVFRGLLRDAFGKSFTGAHEQAWEDALRYVKVGMLWSQYHSGARAARYPRRDGHHA